VQYFVTYLGRDPDLVWNFQSLAPLGLILSRMSKQLKTLLRKISLHSASKVPFPSFDVLDMLSRVIAKDCLALGGH
jgi:hypothetical protein